MMSTNCGSTFTSSWTICTILSDSVAFRFQPPSDLTTCTLTQLYSDFDETIAHVAAPNTHEGWKWTHFLAFTVALRAIDIAMLYVRSHPF